MCGTFAAACSYCGRRVGASKVVADVFAGACSRLFAWYLLGAWSRFGKKIADNKWLAFPAVLVAELSGRTFFVALAAIFQGVSSINATMAWAQIQTGAIGLVVQALIAPLIVIGLNYLMSKNKSER